MLFVIPVEVLEGQLNLLRVELGEVHSQSSWEERGGSDAMVLQRPQLRFYTGLGQQRCFLIFLTFVIILLRTRSEFIKNPGPHKVLVKFILFSDTEERAFPFRREAAKKDSELMSFGCVLWRQEEASILKSRFGLELAPAVVFIKDPGVQPITVNCVTPSWKLWKNIKFMLQSITASKLGCDPADFSAAGKDVETWYCIVVAGRPGFQLDQLCSTMRIVQDELINFAITASLLNPSMRLAGRTKFYREFLIVFMMATQMKFHSLLCMLLASMHYLAEQKGNTTFNRVCMTDKSFK
ncbi:hypothetical protein SELMODRAFT_423325 [Selaginella moellendorffii]|uniref:Thioredoxin-like fold domain-containing protein n=1 Tax=Selaginella moellendorffii TaxID=88036 RepID=D8SLA8_SELML|nr:hypothetical protein SELMODRAFT_423325 [Selaginella moellendorffii]